MTARLCLPRAPRGCGRGVRPVPPPPARPRLARAGDGDSPGATTGCQQTPRPPRTHPALLGATFVTGGPSESPWGSRAGGTAAPHSRPSRPRGASGDPNSCPAPRHIAEPPTRDGDKAPRDPRGPPGWAGPGSRRPRSWQDARAGSSGSSWGFSTGKGRARGSASTPRIPTPRPGGGGTAEPGPPSSSPALTPLREHRGVLPVPPLTQRPQSSAGAPGKPGCPRGSGRGWAGLSHGRGIPVGRGSGGAQPAGCGASGAGPGAAPGGSSGIPEIRARSSGSLQEGPSGRGQPNPNVPFLDLPLVSLPRPGGDFGGQGRSLKRDPRVSSSGTPENLGSSLPREGGTAPQPLCPGWCPPVPSWAHCHSVPGETGWAQLPGVLQDLGTRTTCWAGRGTRPCWAVLNPTDTETRGSNKPGVTSPAPNIHLLGVTGMGELRTSCPGGIGAPQQSCDGSGGSGDPGDSASAPRGAQHPAPHTNGITQLVRQK